MNNVIILLGQRVRSGTNFIASTLSMHPDVETLPPKVSLGEFNLFNDRAIIEDVFNKVSKKSFGLNISKNSFTIFLENYGAFWISFLSSRFNIPQGKTIFIKSPIISNIDLWEAAFPNSKIAIVYRDGRDNVISSIKASNDDRNWYDFSTKIKKKLNFLSGRYFVNHSKHWAKTAFIIDNINETKKVKKFKYEELNNSKDQIKKLLEYYDLKVTDEIIKSCLDAPVVGSSFRNDSKNSSKPNWIPDTDKSKYIFTNKWKKWGGVKRFVFKKIAGDELIQLGYENNNNW